MGKNDDFREDSEVYVDYDVEEEEDEEEEGIDATTTESEHTHRRDEVGEVRKMSSKDTRRLRLWRIVVTSVILLTAFAVTFTTYKLLKQQEDENFKTAVCCWSKQFLLTLVLFFSCILRRISII